MVELVVIMIIIGVLAAVAAPRFFTTSTFQSRGFADQVQSSLRYAQKTAIAQHRNVCVAIAANAISLNIASASGATNACDTNLIPPIGQAPDCPSATYKICPPAAVTLSITPASSPFPGTFSFDALGKPFDTLGGSSIQKTITISGATNSIVVEAETGYVHSP